MNKLLQNLNRRLSSAPKSALSPIDDNMLYRATRLASESAVRPYRMGAVLYNKAQIHGQGTNVAKTHPFQSRWCKRTTHMHAETVALLRAMSDGTQSLYCIAVSRVTRDNGVGCSYPCDECLAMLTYAGLTRIVCYDEHAVATRIDL